MRGILSAAERLTLPSSPEEGSALARRYGRRLWNMVFFGNIVGALPSIIGTAGGAAIDPDPSRAVRDTLLSAASQAVYIVLVAIGTLFFVRKVFRPIAAWLGSARTPTDGERHTLSALPRICVVWSVVVWALVVVWSPPYAVFVVKYSASVPFILFQNVVLVIGGGATGVILCYLLVERMLRPLLGLALRGSATPRPSAIGALPRLLMAFVAGVGAPMVALGVGLVGLGPRQRAAAEPAIWLGMAVVVFGGFIVAVVSARAVTDPITEIRERFRRLQTGELDVDVDVTEPGEIGQLQADFNEMVSGLKERERIRDVFIRHVGKEVVERALDGASTIGGEVCEATAMFVDVVGSTPLAQFRGEYDYWELLNSFFDVVVRVTAGEGGFVNQFQGDGALCIFGAPVAQPDHAARGLRSARVLRSELDAFAERTGVHAVIGLSTGSVVAGNIGTADRFEFTVVGDAVNEAKRLAEQAKTSDAKVLVSEATIRSAEGEVANWREAGSTHLRGRNAPTLAFSPHAPAEDAPAPRLSST